MNVLLSYRLRVSELFINTTRIMFISINIYQPFVFELLDQYISLIINIIDLKTHDLWTIGFALQRSISREKEKKRESFK